MLSASFGLAFSFLFTCDALGIAKTKPAIPIYASPYLLFDGANNEYAPGTAPSIWSGLFPSLTSARTYDPSATIVYLTNFALNEKDQSEADRMKLHGFVMPDKDFSTVCPKTARVRDRFSSVCPIGGAKHLGGSGIVGVARMYYVRCAMEFLRDDMIFFVEGDNLMADSVQKIAESLDLRGQGYLATHNHVSLHASFLSYEFVEAFTKYTADLVQHGFQFHGQCAMTGRGSDMRLSYYASLELHRLRLERGRGPAKILNSQLGSCRVQGRPWEDAVGPWCKESGVRDGPCALQPLIDDYEAAQFARKSNLQKTTPGNSFPQLYECDGAIDLSKGNCVHWGLQQNMQGGPLNQSPGKNAPPTVYAELSTRSKCRGRRSEMNKQVVFSGGRALVPIKDTSASDIRYVAQFNLHFQGGTCKDQMESIWAALRRSKEQNTSFSCEAVKNDYGRSYEECLVSGAGATPTNTHLLELCSQEPTPASSSLPSLP